MPPPNLRKHTKAFFFVTTQRFQKQREKKIQFHCFVSDIFHIRNTPLTLNFFLHAQPKRTVFRWHIWQRLAYVIRLEVRVCGHRLLLDSPIREKPNLFQLAAVWVCAKNTGCNCLAPRCSAVTVTRSIHYALVHAHCGDILLTKQITRGTSNDQMLTVDPDWVSSARTSRPTEC